MQSPAADASAALTEALTALHAPPSDPHAHAHAARRVSRLADDAELAALEARDPAQRADLLAAVKAARRAAAEARQTARTLALSDARDALLPSSDPAAATAATRIAASGTGTSAAAELAADINSALRRATAVISDEVARSRAAGSVLDNGTKRLSATSRQHARFGGAMRAGGKTLRALRMSEMAANVAVVLSLAFFFCIAAYVASRRVGRSTLVAVTIKPGVKVARAPIAVARAMWRAAAGGRHKRASRPDDTSPRDADPGYGARRPDTGRQDTGLREEPVAVGSDAMPERDGAAQAGRPAAEEPVGDGETASKSTAQDIAGEGDEHGPDDAAEAEQPAAEQGDELARSEL